VNRKLFYIKVNKHNTDKTLVGLLNYIRKNIDSDRNAITLKLGANTGKDLTNNLSGNEFDSKVKPLMDKYVEREQFDTRYGYSYNVSGIPEFESFVLHEYLRD
jgi:hypothetical protein